MVLLQAGREVQHVPRSALSAALEECADAIFHTFLLLDLELFEPNRVARD